MRKTISGPVVKWLSRVEEVKTKVAPPPSSTGYGLYAFTPRPYAYQLPGPVNGHHYPLQVATGSGSDISDTSQAATTSTLPAQTSIVNPSKASTIGAVSSNSSGLNGTVTIPATQTSYPYSYTMAAPPPSRERLDRVAKSYVVHELDQVEGVRRPGWEDTMEAMFGDHVNWGEVKVFTGKNRPLGKLKFPQWRHSG